MKSFGTGAQAAIDTPQTDLQDLTSRCNAAIRTAAGGDAKDANIILAQLLPGQLVAQGAVIEGVAKSQSQAIAARVATLSGHHQFRLADLQGARPYQVASIDNGVRTDASTNVSRPNPWDVFGTTTFNSGKRDGTANEDGYTVDSWSIFSGADYAFNNHFTVGSAFGFARTEANITNSAGSVDNNAWTLAVYGTWAPPSGIYASVYADYTWIDYRSVRKINYVEPALAAGAFDAKPAQTINRVATGSTGAGQYEFSGQLGYAYHHNDWDYGPVVSINYRKLEIDRFAESGAAGLDMTIQNQRSDSLLMSIGADVTRHISMSYGVLSPFGHAGFLYEALDNRRGVNLNYTVDPYAGTGTSPVIHIITDAPSRARAELEGGASLQLAGGTSGFLQVGTIVGERNVQNYSIAFGIRHEF